MTKQLSASPQCLLLLVVRTKIIQGIVPPAELCYYFALVIEYASFVLRIAGPTLPSSLTTQPGRVGEIALLHLRRLMRVNYESFVLKTACPTLTSS